MVFQNSLFVGRLIMISSLKCLLGLKTIAIKDSEAVFRRAWEMKRPSTVETTLAMIKSIGRQVGQRNGYRSKTVFFSS